MTENSAVATHAGVRRWPRELGFVAGALAVPAGIGVAVSAVTGSRRAGIVAGGVSVLAAAALRWQLQRWFTIQPAYEVEQQIGELEIRRYAPRIEARTRVSAGFELALDEGFRRLAGYIFGGNAGSERLAMTSPVTANGERIEMTTPVTATTGGEHIVTFTMPPGKTLADLPAPDDARVELAEAPARRFAVLRFRSRYSHEIVEEHGRHLRELVANAGLPGTGKPMFAGYDPPWTLPFLRRVEVWLELA